MRSMVNETSMLQSISSEFFNSPTRPYNISVEFAGILLELVPKSMASYLILMNSSNKDKKCAIVLKDTNKDNKTVFVGYIEPSTEEGSKDFNIGFSFDEDAISDADMVIPSTDNAFIIHADGIAHHIRTNTKISFRDYLTIPGIFATTMVEVKRWLKNNAPALQGDTLDVEVPETVTFHSTNKGGEVEIGATPLGALKTLFKKD